MITNVSFGNYCLDVHISVSSIFIQSSSDGTSFKAERVEKDEVQASLCTTPGITRVEKVSEDPQSQASAAQVSSLKLTKIHCIHVVDIFLASQ